MKTTIAAATLALAVSTPAMAYGWTLSDCRELHDVTIPMATEAYTMRLEQRSLADAHQATMDIFAAEAPTSYFASWPVGYSMAVTSDVYESPINLVRAIGVERAAQIMADGAYESCVEGVE